MHRSYTVRAVVSDAHGWKEGLGTYSLPIRRDFYLVILSTSDFSISNFHELPCTRYPHSSLLGQEQTLLQVHSDMRAQCKGMRG